VKVGEDGGKVGEGGDGGEVRAWVAGGGGGGNCDGMVK
jgi:hypothetical protein